MEDCFDGTPKLIPMRQDNFYITGGTLPPDASSYVERAADRDLLASLLAGDYCYVLNSRQMGKSSLCVRTMQKLRESGIRTCFLDLTKFGGRNLTAEQWYIALLSEAGRELGLRSEFLTYWKENGSYPPVQRLFGAITEVALHRMDNGLLMVDGGSVSDLRQPSNINQQQPQPIVIFIDEIDVTLNMPFSTDEFFAAIRQCYVGRATDSSLKGISFCLLGTATPADLIKDTRVSPFNIGRRIEIKDFTREEAASLANGLLGPSNTLSPQTLLNRILYWTNGHPYLTQRLCRAISEAVAVPNSDLTSPNSLVDKVCSDLFLTHAAKESDDNLAFVRNRLLKSEADLAALLDIYRRIRSGNSVPDDETNPLCALLKLSGIAKVNGGNLVVRNPIYSQVFDGEWIETHMPDAERRRQRAAYRRGVLRTAAVSACLMVVMGAMAVTAVLNANSAKTAARNMLLAKGEADKQRQLAVRAAQVSATLARSEAAAKSEAISDRNKARLERQAALKARNEAIAARNDALMARSRAAAAGSKAQREAENALRLQRLADARSRLLNQRLVQDQIAQGERLAESGDPTRALLHYVEAFRLDGETSPAAMVHRQRIASVLARSPVLEEVVWMPYMSLLLESSKNYLGGGGTGVSPSTIRGGSLPSFGPPPPGGVKVGKNPKGSKPSVIVVDEPVRTPKSLDARRREARDELEAMSGQVARRRIVPQNEGSRRLSRPVEVVPGGMDMSVRAAALPYLAGNNSYDSIMSADGRWAILGVSLEFRGVGAAMLEHRGDKPMRLIDARTGAVRWTLSEPVGSRDHFQVSPDGWKLLWVKGNKLLFADMRVTPRQWRSLPDGWPVTDAVFSPDGTCIVLVEKEKPDQSNSNDAHDVRVFDTVTGAKVAAWRLTAPSPPQLVFTPDGSRLVVRAGNVLSAWQKQTGRFSELYSVGSSSVRNGAINILPLTDNTHVIFSLSEAEAGLLNLQTGKLEKTVALSSSYRSKWRVGPDGDTIVSYGQYREREIRPIRLASHTSPIPVVHFRNELSNAVFDQSGAKLLTYDGDLAYKWRLAEEKPEPAAAKSIWQHSYLEMDYMRSWNPSGVVREQIGFDRKADGTLVPRDHHRLWNFRTLRELEGLPNLPATLRMPSADGKFLLYAAADWKPTPQDPGGLRVWSVAEKKWIGPVIADVPAVGQSQVTDALTGDGSAVLTLKGDTVFATDSRTGRDMGSWQLTSQFKDRLSYFQLNREPLYLGHYVVISDFGELQILDLRSPGSVRVAPLAPKYVYTGGAGNSLVSASENGSRFAAQFSSHSRGAVGVYRLPDGARVGPLLMHAGHVSRVEFSKDGNRVATAEGRTVRVWDPVAGRLVTSPIIAPEAVDVLSFSKSGRFLAVLAKQSVLVYSIADGRLLYGPHTYASCNQIRFGEDDRTVYGLSHEGYWRIDLPSVSGSIEQLEDIAALLNGAWLDPRGDVVHLDPSELYELWTRIGKSYLAGYARKVESDEEFHIRRFQTSKDSGEAWTAAWHANQLSAPMREKLLFRELLMLNDGSTQNSAQKLALDAIAQLTPQEFSRVIEQLYPGQNGDGTTSAAHIALMEGDMPKYLRQCQLLLKQAASQQKPQEILNLIASCRYMPSGATEYAAMETQISRIRKLDPTVLNNAVTPGFVLYRSGHYQQAFDSIQAAFKEQKTEGTSWGLLLQAMALHRLGKHSEARRLFDAAKRQKAGDWIMWVEVEWLKREAGLVLER